LATAHAGDGTVIYYETWGRGEPLLLISGLATDLRIWACQRLVFGRRFRCHRHRQPRLGPLREA